MKKISTKSIQIFVCTLVYMLCGMFIFNPIYKAQTFALSFIISAFTGGVLLEIYLYFFCCTKLCKAAPLILARVSSVVCCVLSAACVLLLLTEVIKDVSYVAGRSISLVYYTGLALCLLAVSCYLCFNSEKGIFRFSFICCGSFIILFICIAFVFISTKSAVFSFTRGYTGIQHDIGRGILSGLFFSADMSMFMGSFHGYLTNSDGAPDKKTIRIGFYSSYIILFTLGIICNLVFGRGLLVKLSDPVYAAIKLFPGMDLTELISVIRITSFLIKSSVYIYFSSSAFKGAFFSKDKCLIYIILSQYALIPFAFLITALFDKQLKFGAFQDFIYPIALGLGLFSFIQHLLCNKKN